MPSGQYNRTKTRFFSPDGEHETKDNDDRAVLCLLPGKLRMRQLIEQEVGRLRVEIQQGHPELIALLPGLELGMKNVTDELGAFLNGTPRNDMPRNGTAYSRPQPVAPKQITAKEPKAEKVVDVNSIVHRPVSLNIHSGKRGVTMLYRILEHFVTHGQELVVEEFTSKWISEYPALAQRATLSQAVARLRDKRKLDIQSESGSGGRDINRYILRTKLSGMLLPPVDKDTVQADEIESAPVVEPGPESEPGPVAEPEPEPTPAAESVRFEGTQGEILVQEALANNNRFNIVQLAEKYGINFNVLYPAISDLKHRRGAKFTALGNRNYIMTKPPEGYKLYGK